MASPNDKENLIAELSDARTRLTGNFRALKYELNVVPRLRSNIARNRLAWFSAFAIGGLILSRILVPQQKVIVKTWGRNETAANAGKAAFGVTVLKIALDFAKPAILRYIAERLRRPKT